MHERLDVTIVDSVNEVIVAGNTGNQACLFCHQCRYGEILSKTHTDYTRERERGNKCPTTRSSNANATVLILIGPIDGGCVSMATIMFHFCFISKLAVSIGNGNVTILLLRHVFDISTHLHNTTYEKSNIINLIPRVCNFVFKRRTRM